MDNIQIFYGSENKFKDIIPETFTSLTNLVTKLEGHRKTYRVIQGDEDIPDLEFEIYKDFVAYGNEFLGINESFILNLVSYLSNLEFDKIYLHNPPDVIVEQLQKHGYSIRIKKQEYETLKKQHIRKIHKQYNDEIIGQDLVKTEILLSLLPLISSDTKKPVVLLFYGPSGVGKTETAKYLSRMVSGELFRKQFSMFQTNDYSDYLYGGNVNERSLGFDLLKRDSNIILFDEFDKVHSHFHSAFYEMFDEGRFSDKNYSVELNKTIIICTSNYQNEKEIRESLGEAIFSRFDNVIKFEELSPEAKMKIADKKINELYEHYTPVEKDLIDKGAVREYIHRKLMYVHNVREIEKSIKKLFSIYLLQDILEEGT